MTGCTRPRLSSCYGGGPGALDRAMRSPRSSPGIPAAYRWPMGELLAAIAAGALDDALAPLSVAEQARQPSPRSAILDAIRERSRAITEG